jgi:hypothetical protein
MAGARSRKGVGWVTSWPRRPRPGRAAAVRQTANRPLRQRTARRTGSVAGPVLSAPCPATRALRARAGERPSFGATASGCVLRSSSASRSSSRRSRGTCRRDAASRALISGITAAVLRARAELLRGIREHGAHREGSARVAGTLVEMRRRFARATGAMHRTSDDKLGCPLRENGVRRATVGVCQGRIPAIRHRSA